MSLNRENRVWQSENGTWNIGFFPFYQTGDDPEWDVEYDFSRFDYVSTGHRTEVQASRSHPYPNPGGGWVSAFDQEPEECKKFDHMVWRFNHPAEAQEMDAKAASDHWGAKILAAGVRLDRLSSVQVFSGTPGISSFVTESVKGITRRTQDGAIVLTPLDRSASSITIIDKDGVPNPTVQSIYTV